MSKAEGSGLSTGGILKAARLRTRRIGRELLENAERLYGDSTPPAPLETKPVIYEYDLSNRSGLEQYQSSYWLRGKRIGQVNPYYRRKFVFPRPLLSPESGSYYLHLGNTALLPHEEPVDKFFRFVHNRMEDQIPEMTLRLNVIDLMLMHSADVEWQRETPEVFTAQLRYLMAAMHPDFPLCTVERAEAPGDASGSI
jgi:hypothetical protein